MRTTESLLFLATFCALPYLAREADAVESMTKTAAPPIASTARSAAGFLPKGWYMEAHAEGDLNKDGLKDSVLVMSDTDPAIAAKSVGERRLLIALRDADGLLHKSAESESAVSLLGNPPRISIKNDVLDLEATNEKGKTIYKYQLRNGQWDLIGYTHVEYDSDTTRPRESIDLNLLTGDVVAASRRREYHSKHFLEVRSPLIDGAESCAADWTAPAVWLNPKSQQCPIVAVLSVHNKNTLFIRSELEGAYDIADEDVALLNSSGVVVPAVSKKRTTYGYILASYDLRSLVPESGTDNSESPSDEPKRDDPLLLRLSVKVTPSHSGCKKTFSTGSNGDAGAILLTKLKSLPTLMDIDVRSGAAIQPTFAAGDCEPKK